MGGLYQPYERDQGFLLPPSPREWLPKDHLVYFLIDVVDQLDLSPIEARYREAGSGNVSYHPRLMVTLLVYAYATGVFSSRKIERAIEENVAFRVVAAGQQPNFRTIARFRRQHADAFEELFVQIVQMAARSGLVKIGTLALDGTKIKADASRKKSRTYKQLKAEERRLQAEIAARLKAADDVDQAEDDVHGDDRGDELPPELVDREERLRRIREAKRQLEERQREADADRIAAEKERKKQGKRSRARRRPLGEPEEHAQQNLTDPESRIMKFPTGAWFWAYNAQVATTSDTRLIVAQSVTQCAGDQRSLVPMVDAVEANIGERPEVVLADAGYRSETGFAGLEERGVEGYVALRKKGNGLPEPNENYPATARMCDRLRTRRGGRLCELRKQIVEPVFGWIKRCLGFERFSMRSSSRAAGEWSLVCLSLNLRRMARLLASDAGGRHRWPPG